MDVGSLHYQPHDEGLSAALKAWQDISLTNLQRELDVQGLEIAENQKESLQGRKRLAEQTKEFKKYEDTEKLAQFPGLLKSYQKEIDNITKRCKTAETGFLHVYKLLVDAPDPLPIISAASEQLKQNAEFFTLADENRRLKEEIGEAHREMRELRALDGERGLLKTRLAKYEAMLEEMVKEKVNAKETEMKQTMDDKIRVYKETEYSLQRQLNKAKDQLLSLQSSHEMSQARLVDNTQKYDEQVAGKLAELEIVLMDLDQANMKIAHLERANELLKDDLAKYRPDGIHMEFEDPAELAKRNKLQEAEISRLISEAEQLKRQISTIEANARTRTTQLEFEIRQRESEIRNLREEARKFGDYDRIKHELEVLKSIEFPGTEEEDASTWADWGAEPSSTAPIRKSLDNSTSAPSSQQGLLERMLLEKSRKLQTELTNIKVQYSEAKEQLEEAKGDLEYSKERVEQQEKLIWQLEEDLRKLSVGGAKSGGGGKWPGGPIASLDPYSVGSPALSAVQLDPLASIEASPPSLFNSMAITRPKTSGLASNVYPPVSPTDERASGKSTPALPSSSAVGAAASSSSIIPILTSQRDRYRLKIDELEQQNRVNLSTINDLRIEVESVKSDNIKLYEKLRFTQSYSASSSSQNYTSGAGRRAGNFDSKKYEDDDFSISIGGSRSVGEDVSNKYQAIYEGNLDPFQRFHRQEEARRLNSLSSTEKATLKLTRMVIGNKYTRLIFVLYSLSLHALVIGTLYKLSLTEECRHDHERWCLDVNNTVPAISGNIP